MVDRHIEVMRIVVMVGKRGLRRQRHTTLSIGGSIFVVVDALGESRFVGTYHL